MDYYLAKVIKNRATVGQTENLYQFRRRGIGSTRDVRMQPLLWNSGGIPNFGEAMLAGEKINCPSGEVELEKKLKRSY